MEDISAHLGPESGELRLRVGDYGVLLTDEYPDILRIPAVLHCREAYR